MFGLISLWHLFWLAVMAGILVVAHRNRETIRYKTSEFMVRLRSRFGGYTSINDHFVRDLEDGFSSQNFDLTSANSNDTRSGLDEASKQEIRRIMEEQGLGFDQARLVYTTRKFGAHGIAPDGMPLDPKVVTFRR
uniref:UPF0357 protein AAL017W n=1 Tax=Eremothecium gossypii (strain ATCC 10895 / CBS 109.51 / FGSC 9923 / NRRL Y-1056) TaxID=284811 RepID=YCB2_EREGS|nr:RecName: Full=UPF0357 protein AAL017W; Flags: Precursor [Eremothecium gossypii ATCC 10895]AAO21871.1 YCL012Cp [Eremothecium gossypii]